MSIALLTGATGGLGHEFVDLLARDGHHVILAARDQEKVSELAQSISQKYGTKTSVVLADLAQPQGVEILWKQITTLGLTIDILINNAGFGVYGPFLETDVQKELDMMQVNMAALTHLTKLCLPDMIAKKQGKILNIASAAAFQPGPLAAVYYASKAYVLSFSEALRNELHGSGVAVTTLCPGPTATGFAKRSAMDTSKLFQKHVMDPKTVAAAGYQALQKGQGILIPGFRNKILTFLARHSPSQVSAAVVRRIQARIM